MGQVIKMAHVIAFKFKAGAVTGTSPQRVLSILKRIAENQVPAALQVLTLPRVSELLETFEHREQAKVHRAHVERCEFWLKDERRLDPLLNSHIGGAPAGQIHHSVGRLFDLWQEGREGRGSLVRLARLRIARMQMHDRRASFRCRDRGLGNLSRRHREIGRHRRCMDGTSDSTGNDDLLGHGSLCWATIKCHAAAKRKDSWAYTAFRRDESYAGFPTTKPRDSALRAVTKEVVGIHVLLPARFLAAVFRVSCFGPFLQ